MSKGREFICWFDLEATGSRDDDDILEIGISLTDKELNEIDSRSFVLPMMQGKLESMEDVVVKMHTDNGLISDSMQIGFFTSEMEKDMYLAQIDEELDRWIRSYAGNNHVPFAGSGVQHYDRKYIKRDLPLFNKRLTFWALDVGVIRRVLKYAGITAAADLNFRKTHRALDDARVHCQEMRSFLDWCKRAVSRGMSVDIK